MEKDDGIVILEEILGGGGTTGTGGEVVDEAHGLALQRNGRAAGCDEDDAVTLVLVVLNEVFGELRVKLESFRRWIGAEVVGLSVVCDCIRIRIAVRIARRWLQGVRDHCVCRDR